MSIRIRNLTEEEQREAKGRCYIRSFGFMSKLTPEQEKHALLVHGKVVGVEGRLANVRYGHAWVEVDDFVLEFPYRKKLPIRTKKNIYYMLNRVSEVKKYSKSEMYEVGLANGGHYGPWL